MNSKKNENLIIRLTIAEKKNINFAKNKLTLFYLKQTTVKKGKIYTIPTILKYGKRFTNGQKEILPKLSFKNAIRVKCLEVKNNLKYENLPKNIFNNSLQNIQNIENLQKSIIRRYKKSRPFLSTKEITDSGICYTNLQILD